MGDNLFDLTGKTAIVTGGGSGIGKAIAALFAKQGAEVIIIGRREDQLKEACDEISSEKCSFFACDLSKKENIQETFSKIIEKHAKIDILVNNVGIYKENNDTHKINKDGTIDLDKSIINELINLNILSYWAFGLHVSEVMKKNKNGVIINISSVNGICGKVVCDIYDMTKAAVNNLTLNQATQLADYNIRANAICPSSTVTPMRDRTLGTSEKREKFDKLEASMIPLKRLGKPEDIAHCALYLASDEASYITGQIISVDGGFLLTRDFPARYPNKE